LALEEKKGLDQISYRRSLKRNLNAVDNYLAANLTDAEATVIPKPILCIIITPYIICYYSLVLGNTKRIIHQLDVQLMKRCWPGGRTIDMSHVEGVDDG